MDLPVDNDQYMLQAYWDERYKSEKVYDWFTSYQAFKHLVTTSVSPNDKILMLGSGNSTLSEEMYRDGYCSVTNMDYSAVVIENMRDKCRDLHGMTWDIMDVTAMTYPIQSFDVVMEKGTLDALLVGEKDPWQVSQESQDLMHKILSQVSAILKPGGRFISITFADPFFRKGLYARDGYNWSITTQTFGQNFHFYYIVMKKGESLSENDVILRKKFVERHSVSPGKSGQADQKDTEWSDSDTEDFLFNVQLQS